MDTYSNTKIRFTNFISRTTISMPCLRNSFGLRYIYTPQRIYNTTYLQHKYLYDVSVTTDSSCTRTHLQHTYICNIHVTDDTFCTHTNIQHEYTNPKRHTPTRTTLSAHTHIFNTNTQIKIDTRLQDIRH